MHILVTDSGLGGLSVCAYAERFVRLHGVSEPVRLTFANAAPANDYGYNSMPSSEEKVRTFDRFLRNVTARLAPDSIFVACNTLSVLLPETPYFEHARIPVKGIVETGLELLVAELGPDPRSVALIFGTPTTIEAGAYPRSLEKRGVASARIVSQACPGLADTISEDREGTRSEAEIRGWVARAIEKLPGVGVPVIAFLACTHYGYRRELFSAAFEERGIAAKVIDPNESAAGGLFAPGGQRRGDRAHRDVEVQFVTKYAIPETALEALSFFLGDISPRTVSAMRSFVHLPDLF